MLCLQEVLPEDDFAPVARTQLRLLVMPEGTVKGLFYPTEWKHPLQKHTAVLVSVTELGEDNGLYKVPVKVSDSFLETQASLCKVQKLDIELPVSERAVPRFDAGQLKIEPEENNIVDLKAKPRLRDTLIKGMRKFHGSAKLDFIT